MTDRSTKIILIAIACGLWANVAVQMTRPAVADSLLWDTIREHLAVIEGATRGTETHVYRIDKGECQNKKLC